MKRTLHDFQQNGLERLAQSLRDGHRRPMFQNPTGGGKTVVGGEIINRALAKGKRVIFVVPAIDLIDQTVSSFFNAGITMLE